MYKWFKYWTWWHGGYSIYTMVILQKPKKDRVDMTRVVSSTQFSALMKLPGALKAGSCTWRRGTVRTNRYSRYVRRLIKEQVNDAPAHFHEIHSCMPWRVSQDAICTPLHSQHLCCEAHRHVISSTPKISMSLVCQQSVCVCVCFVPFPTPIHFSWQLNRAWGMTGPWFWFEIHWMCLGRWGRVSILSCDRIGPCRNTSFAPNQDLQLSVVCRIP